MRRSRSRPSASKPAPQPPASSRWLLWGSYAAYGVSLVACLLILDRYPPLSELHRILPPLLTILLGLAGVLMALLSSGRLLSDRRMWWAVALPALACIYPLILLGNGVLDRKEPVRVEGPVVSKGLGTGKQRGRKYLYLSVPYRGQEYRYRLSVSASAFDSAEPGDTARIRVSEGALGIPWSAGASFLESREME